MRAAASWPLPAPVRPSGQASEPPGASAEPGSERPGSRAPADGHGPSAAAAACLAAPSVAPPPTSPLTAGCSPGAAMLPESRTAESPEAGALGVARAAALGLRPPTQLGGDRQQASPEGCSSGPDQALGQRQPSQGDRVAAGASVAQAAADKEAPLRGPEASGSDGPRGPPPAAPAPPPADPGALPVETPLQLDPGARGSEGVAGGVAVEEAAIWTDGQQAGSTVVVGGGGVEVQYWLGRMSGGVGGGPTGQGREKRKVYRRRRKEEEEDSDKSEDEAVVMALMKEEEEEEEENEEEEEMEEDGLDVVEVGGDEEREGKEGEEEEEEGEHEEKGGEQMEEGEDEGQSAGAGEAGASVPERQQVAGRSQLGKRASRGSSQEAGRRRQRTQRSPTSKGSGGEQEEEEEVEGKGHVEGQGQETAKEAEAMDENDEARGRENGGQGHEAQLQVGAEGVSAGGADGAAQVGQAAEEGGVGRGSGGSSGSGRAERGEGILSKLLDRLGPALFSGSKGRGIPPLVMECWRRINPQTAGAAAGAGARAGAGEGVVLPAQKDTEEREGVERRGEEGLTGGNNPEAGTSGEAKGQQGEVGPRKAAGSEGGGTSGSAEKSDGEKLAEENAERQVHEGGDGCKQRTNEEEREAASETGGALTPRSAAQEPGEKVGPTQREGGEEMEEGEVVTEEEGEEGEEWEGEEIESEKQKQGLEKDEEAQGKSSLEADSREEAGEGGGRWACEQGGGEEAKREGSSLKDRRPEGRGGQEEREEAGSAGAASPGADRQRSFGLVVPDSLPTDDAVLPATSEGPARLEGAGEGQLGGRNWEVQRPPTDGASAPRAAAAVGLTAGCSSPTPVSSLRSPSKQLLLLQQQQQQQHGTRHQLLLEAQEQSPQQAQARQQLPAAQEPQEHSPTHAQARRSGRSHKPVEFYTPTTAPRLRDWSSKARAEQEKGERGKQAAAKTAGKGSASAAGKEGGRQGNAEKAAKKESSGGKHGRRGSPENAKGGKADAAGAGKKGAAHAGTASSHAGRSAKAPNGAAKEKKAGAREEPGGAARQKEGSKQQPKATAGGAVKSGGWLDKAVRELMLLERQEEEEEEGGKGAGAGSATGAATRGRQQASDFHLLFEGPSNQQEKKGTKAGDQERGKLAAGALPASSAQSRSIGGVPGAGSGALRGALSRGGLAADARGAPRSSGGRQQGGSGSASGGSHLPVLGMEEMSQTARFLMGAWVWPHAMRDRQHAGRGAQASQQGSPGQEGGQSPASPDGAAEGGPGAAVSTAASADGTCAADVGCVDSRGKGAAKGLKAAQEAGRKREAGSPPGQPGGSPPAGLVDQVVLALLGSQARKGPAEHPGRVGDGGGGQGGGQRCSACGEAEDSATLLCDDCEAAYHLRCVAGLRGEAPDSDEWLCSSCTARQEERGNAVVLADVAAWERRWRPGASGSWWHAGIEEEGGVAAMRPHFMWDEGGSEGAGATAERGPAGKKEAVEEEAGGTQAGQGRAPRGQWLLRSEWLAAQGHIRIGPMFQAEVPAWQEGKTRVEGAGRGRAAEGPLKRELQDEGEKEEGGADWGWEVPFGSEVALTAQEKEAELREMEERLRVGTWPLGWQPASSVPPSAAERWAQCRGLRWQEGPVRPDGRRTRREVECGKWRRVAPGVEISDSWDCSCTLPFDPHSADCAVPQELSRKDLEKRLRQIEELRVEAQARADGRQWGQWLQRLKAFRQAEGHCHVPQDSPLGLWLEQQRAAVKRGRLTVEQKEELEQVGVLLGPEDQRWEENFALLVAFHRTHGHCNVRRTAQNWASWQPWDGGTEGGRGRGGAPEGSGASREGSGAGGRGEGQGGSAQAALAAAAAYGESRAARAKELTRLAQWCRAQQQLAEEPFKNKKMMQRICRLLEIGFVFGPE